MEVIIILIVFGLGYAAGRRVGEKQGQQLGLVQTVIDLRIKALEHGICPICRCNFITMKNDRENLV